METNANDLVAYWCMWRDLKSFLMDVVSEHRAESADAQSFLSLMNCVERRFLGDV